MSWHQSSVTKAFSMFQVENILTKFSDCFILWNDQSSGEQTVFFLKSAMFKLKISLHNLFALMLWFLDFVSFSYFLMLLGADLPVTAHCSENQCLKMAMQDDHYYNYFQMLLCQWHELYLS